MLKWKQGVRTLVACSVVALVIVLLATNTKISAAAIPNLEKATDVQISGDGMIWLETQDAGQKKLVYFNTVTGEKKDITTGSPTVDAPYLAGDYIVWADKGAEPNATMNWDIMRYQISTGSKTKLNTKAGQYSNPTVDANGALWYDRTNYGFMMYYDFSTGRESNIGEGRFPVLVEGVVVYKHARDGGVSLLKLKTGVKRPLIMLGGSNHIDSFVFNGTHILALQRNEQGESKYVSMDVLNNTSSAKDVTEYTSKQQEYAMMAISDTYAAFIENTNGTAVLKTVELNKGKVSTVAISDAMGGLIGINGSQLFYSKPDGGLASINLATGNSNPSPPDQSGTDSDGGIPNGSVQEEEQYSAIINAEGGELATDDQRVVVIFEQISFPAPTKVSITQKRSNQYPLIDENGNELELASGVWQLDAEQSFMKNALLRMSHKLHSYSASEIDKLGIYRWNATVGHWEYIGGANQAVAGFTQASIAQRGTYAIMYRSISFDDIQQHWAQHAIEALAARDIINGVSATSFAPNRSITRAEFTKLLVGAIGIEAVVAEQSSFSDVSSQAWYYSWVETAAAAGIVQGSGDKFKPNDALTREEMMTMLVRAVGTQLGEQNTSSTETELAAFKDSDAVSEWAKSSVAAAIRWNLIEGNATGLKPLQLTTRAESATVIYRLLLALDQL
ncbi:MAG TPA: S-layer homology domain-containing protein [Candidatus Paenibacillus intestinavium]|nr:S-layer homology domain-containing protein [Candidatus Paenibacillus intestinavium]